MTPRGDVVRQWLGLTATRPADPRRPTGRAAAPADEPAAEAPDGGSGPGPDAGDRAGTTTGLQPGPHAHRPDGAVSPGSP